jgi:hypothetical protein
MAMDDAPPVDRPSQDRATRRREERERDQEPYVIKKARLLDGPSRAYVIRWITSHRHPRHDEHAKASFELLRFIERYKPARAERARMFREMARRFPAHEMPPPPPPPDEPWFYEACRELRNKRGEGLDPAAERRRWIDMNRGATWEEAAESCELD